MGGAVLPVVEEALVLEEALAQRSQVGFLVEADGVAGDSLEADASDSAGRGAEVGLQQLVGQSDALEYLGSAVGTDSRDSHLRHDLEQAFFHGLDVVGPGGRVVQLDLAAVGKVGNYCEGQIRIDGRSSIAEQQGRMHGLADLAAFDDQGSLDALSDLYEMVVDGAHSQQRRYGGMCFVDTTVGEYDIVDAFVDTVAGLFAEVFNCVPEVGSSFLPIVGDLEKNRELYGREALVADVAEQVELGIRQYRMRQTDHLAVLAVRRQDSGTDPADVFVERHYCLLADRVDRRVGDLSELLAEVVEEALRTLADDCQRRIVAHGRNGLDPSFDHRLEGIFDVFSRKSEENFFAQEIRLFVFDLTSALKVLQLDSVAAEPLTVRVLEGETLLDLRIIENLAFLHVHKEHLARFKATFLRDVFRRGLEYADLAGDHQHVLFGDGVSCRTETVAVKHSAGVAAVGKEQGRRAVPWLHED